MYFLHLFSKKQPDLNWDNPAVRQDVFDMMNWWLKKGVDGFRMDVISLISKEPGLPDKEPGINGYATFNGSANGPHVHEYLQEMRQKALNNADTITVGECSGVTLESIDTFKVAEVVKSVKRAVCHTQFLTLIYIRCTLHHMDTCCKHFCRDFSVFVTVIAETGNASWLVMIFPVETVPCNILKTFLPACKDFFQRE